MDNIISLRKVRQPPENAVKHYALISYNTKESESSYSVDRINWNMQLKNFLIFLGVADGMILCGRNVAFSVWEGRILIESETMAKRNEI